MEVPQNWFAVGLGFRGLWDGFRGPWRCMGKKRRSWARPEGALREHVGSC